MNVTEILALAHIRLGDVALPHLWSDEELVAYLGIAYNEWAKDVRFIKDSSTSSVCTLSLKAVEAIYTMSNLIISVESAWLTSNNTPMYRTSERELDLFRGQWRTDTGTPLWIAPDYENAKIRVYPYYALVPGADPLATVDTLNMDVIRYPLAQLSLASPSASPEIHFTDHIHLVDGILREAYLKPDSQTFNQKASDDYRVIFNGWKEDAKASRIRLSDFGEICAPHYGAL